MTAIVRLVQDDAVWMGCDSIYVLGDSGSRGINTASKVFHGNGWVVGACGPTKTCNAIELAIDSIREINPGEDPRHAAMTIIPTFLADAFNEYGVMAEDGELFEFQGLFATRGHLFQVGPDLGVLKNHDRFASVGPARNVCNGSLLATGEFDVPPRRRITMALHGATYFTDSVAPPFQVYRLEDGHVSLISMTEAA